MAGEDIFTQLLAQNGLGTSPTSSTGISDLNNFSNTVTATDPFGIAGKSLGAWNPNYSTWSPGATAATAFGKSFLTGILGDVAQSNTADQLAKVAAVFPQLENNPSSVDVPEGVDSGAFNTLKLSQMSKKQANDDAIRKTLSAVGINYNAIDGTASNIQGANGGPDLPTLLAQAASLKDTAAAKAKADYSSKTATGNKAMVSVAKDLSSTLAGLDSLNDADKKIDTFPGGKGTLGGIVNYLDQFIPNSPVERYQNNLPSLSDPVAAGLSNTNAQGTQNKVLAELSQGVGTSSDSMHGTVDVNRKVFTDKVSRYLDTLAQAGWPEDGPTPPGTLSLSDMRQKFENARQGIGDPLAAPAAVVTPISTLPDKATFAAAAKAKGLSLEQANEAWAKLGGT